MKTVSGTTKPFFRNSYPSGPAKGVTGLSELAALWSRLPWKTTIRRESLKLFEKGFLQKLQKQVKYTQ